MEPEGLAESGPFSPGRKGARRADREASRRAAFLQPTAGLLRTDVDVIRREQYNAEPLAGIGCFATVRKPVPTAGPVWMD